MGAMLANLYTKGLSPLCDNFATPWMYLEIEYKNVIPNTWGKGGDFLLCVCVCCAHSLKIMYWIQFLKAECQVTKSDTSSVHEQTSCVIVLYVGISRSSFKPPITQKAYYLPDGSVVCVCVCT